MLTFNEFAILLIWGKLEVAKESKKLYKFYVLFPKFKLWKLIQFGGNLNAKLGLNMSMTFVKWQIIFN